MSEKPLVFGTKYKSEKLGQHILTDKTVLEKIIDTSDIEKDDVILEVGPGTGNLTSYLIKRAGKVIAVEKDKDAIKYLKGFFNSTNLFVFEDDILKFNIEERIKGSYKVVANIPYYLTGKLLRNFLERKNKPESMVLMVQKEVAERILARPPHANVLSLSVQFYGVPEIIADVSRDSFKPAPRVESAILKILNIKNHYLGVDGKKFFQLVKIGFSSRRKKLINNLLGFPGAKKYKIEQAFKKLTLDECVRAQELEINDWISLLRLLS